MDETLVETCAERFYTAPMNKLLNYAIIMLLVFMNVAVADTDVAIVQDKALAHTAQILPIDAKGNLVGTEIATASARLTSRCFDSAISILRLIFPRQLA